jgi:hypothetical protein
MAITSAAIVAWASSTCRSLSSHQALPYQQARAATLKDGFDPRRSAIAKATIQRAVAIDHSQRNVWPAGGNPGSIFQPRTGPVPAEDDGNAWSPRRNLICKFSGVVSVAWKQGVLARPCSAIPIGHSSSGDHELVVPQ